jgi:hypothetical protein
MNRDDDLLGRENVIGKVARVTELAHAPESPVAPSAKPAAAR